MGLYADSTRILSYDVYFSKDLKRLQDYFKTLNPTSLGSLIIDFFKYYASKFDYENDVISIRKPQTRKIDKGWEEDMDRDHNFICIEVSKFSFRL